jgi:hypothetical protein
MQAPALAGWTLTPGVSDKPFFKTEQPAPSWTATVRAHSNSVIAKTLAPVLKTTVVANPVICKPIEPRNNSWLIERRPVYVASYVKSVEEAKILNPDIQRFYKNGVPADVPEPGSIVGLSAGLFGLLAQARRMRKRS